MLFRLSSTSSLTSALARDLSLNSRTIQRLLSSRFLWRRVAGFHFDHGGFALGAERTVHWVNSVVMPVSTRQSSKPVDALFKGVDRFRSALATARPARHYS